MTLQLPLQHQHQQQIRKHHQQPSLAPIPSPASPPAHHSPSPPSSGDSETPNGPGGLCQPVDAPPVDAQPDPAHTAQAEQEQRSADPAPSTAGSGAPSLITSLSARLQHHLKLFFSMHHKLFDLVAFYVVMFAINGQMTSLPTRLEWIGFCVQSIVALRRAFQTSIKHGLGLTSFLGMLDLLVGQLFLHQDRLGLLPTVANILVYFYVINLTRGLVFGDSVSCLLWFLFGLVDIYRKDPSSASILDLTPYRVIPVHTVGFGLYILMSELVDVMLHSAEPDPTQGRYLNYVGAQKEGPVSIRSSSRRSLTRPSDLTSGLRFELCITEITPFTVSFCLNALSDAPLPDQSSGQDSGSSTPSAPASPDGSTAGGSVMLTEPVDLSAIKISSAANPSPSSSAARSSKTAATPRIISTSDIVIHVNYIPWQQVQYHFPDEQSFTLYGLTPSTDYEIEMRVYQFSSFITRVGTRAAPPGTPVPTLGPGGTAKSSESAPKTNKNRKNKKNQRIQKDSLDKGGEANRSKATATATTPTSTSTSISGTLQDASAASGKALAVSESVSHPLVAFDENPVSAGELKSSSQLLLEQLQASILASVEAASATKAALKKIKRDQAKAEALLRQELEGIGRGQAKAVIQDQKRRQKLSFLQESIKQADAHASSLQDELADLRESNISSQPRLDETAGDIQVLEQRIQASLANTKTAVAPLKAEHQRLQTEIKRLESERAEWASRATLLREAEVAPLQLRLQRLEQQQIVWKVAADASKDKDREASLKLATLEEDIQKKMAMSEPLERAIQELREKNVRLKESVEQEMEVWETLERELDAEEAQTSLYPLQPLSYASQHYAQPSLLQPHHHLEVSGNSSVRDSHYWLPAGDGVGSGNDMWLNSGGSLLGGGAGDYGRRRTSESQSLWDLTSGSSLDSSRGPRTGGSSTLSEGVEQ